MTTKININPKGFKIEVSWPKPKFDPEPLTPLIEHLKSGHVMSYDTTGLNRTQIYDIQDRCRTAAIKAGIRIQTRNVPSERKLYLRKLTNLNG